MTSDEEHASAAELLSDWRAAERNAVAADKSAKDAARTVAAAADAEGAAMKSEKAADASMDAAVRAKNAAGNAKKAAGRAVEAAQVTTEVATEEQGRAEQVVKKTEKEEAEARERFHAAEEKGFPKAPHEPQSPRLEPNPESG